ncbi:MAG: lysophospholipid acyltransferase family protein [Pirellulales bacterium]
MSERKRVSSIRADERRTWRERFLYRSVRYLSQMVGVFCFDLTCLGRHHLNFDGPALLLSTHQSTLDPVLIGMMSRSEMSYLARKTLFKSRLFAWLILALNAIEIDREGGGLAGLKETMRRLKNGHKVLIFPEGTRTHTGYPAALKPGFISIARRSAVPLVPIAVTGAYQVLQRGSIMPHLYPLCVAIDEPLQPSQVAALSDEELIAELQRRLIGCHQQAIEYSSRACGLRGVSHPG